MRFHLRCTAVCAFFFLLRISLQAQQSYAPSTALLRDMLAGSSTSSSADHDTEAPAEATQDDRKFRSRVTQTPLYDWWRHPGLSVGVGVNGVSVDVAEALRDRINVRVGAEFARYSGHLVEENALLDVNLRLGGGHAGIDIFPLKHSSFRVSPQLRFGIMTRGFGDVTIPPGQVVNFSDKNYTSTTVDPLHGTAYLDTRKVAPGISVGFGNLVPRTRDRHWSFPVDLGFYYIGQPNLQITFTGTACTIDPNKPLDCDDVSQDADFQSNLQKVVAHQRHNASYGSLFPILSYGVGYRF